MPRTHHVMVFLVVLATLTQSGCGRQKLTKLDVAKQRLFHGQRQEALALCNELLAENPKDLNALLLRGQIHEADQNYDLAEADFTRAITTDPQNPEGYFFRYQLFLGQAKAAKAAEGTASEANVAEADIGKRRALEELAAKDHQRYMLLTPESAVPGLNHTVPLPESLTTPLPDAAYSLNDETVVAEETDPLQVAADAAEELPAEDELAIDADGEPTDAGEEPGKETGDPLAEDATGTPTPADQFLADRAESARRIQQLDLEDPSELPEPTLPPHLDLNEGFLVPEVPVPRTVRFGLPPAGTTALGSSPAARKPRPHTTGIMQLPEETAQTWDAVPQRTGTTLGNLSPFVTAPTAHTTGIHGGTRPAGASTAARITPPTGWSPWYRPSTPPLPKAKGETQGPPESDESPDGVDKPKQIISMALPATTPNSSAGTAVGLLPSPWFLPMIPTTGSNSLQGSSR